MISSSKSASGTQRQRRVRRRQAPPRCAAAGCTWPAAPSGTARQSCRERRGLIETQRARTHFADKTSPRERLGQTDSQPPSLQTETSAMYQGIKARSIGDIVLDLASAQANREVGNVPATHPEHGRCATYQSSRATQIADSHCVAMRLENRRDGGRVQNSQPRRREAGGGMRTCPRSLPIGGKS
eukprot:6184984-Pleurochrysis_carterae.AAC.2